MQSIPAIAGPPQEWIVVLDPGHGPARPGAISARGRPEVEFNDRLTKAVAERLRSRSGIRVVLTRGPDQNPSLADRVRVARQVDADLVLSIHHDSVQPGFLRTWRSGEAQRKYCDRFQGYSIFAPTTSPCSGLSLRLARRLADHLMTSGYRFTTHHAEPIPGENRSWLDAGRGIYDGDFLYLTSRLVGRPVVLFEAGVLVHRAEEIRLADEGNVADLAEALAQSIGAFLSRDLGPGRLAAQLLRAVAPFPLGLPQAVCQLLK